jgi:tRNA nucleotidyltransferase (CCA-adding enzyme)
MSYSDMEMAKRLAKGAAELGGCAYFVGGYVRDFLSGGEGKDIDVEVHGLTPDQLKGLLDSLGQRLDIGESFGIFGLKGYDIDIAMPRKESCRGRGHRDFDVFVDPHIGTLGAAKRRDFTVNAMMQNILTGEIVDHFGGREDLEKGIIRHVNDQSFAEDPLRVLRGAQFAARFHCTIAPETVSLCREMPLSHLSRERVWEELRKALMKADRPSVFFLSLREMDQLGTWFPEVKDLIGVEQNPVYHAEGDVFNHTMMVLDEAAKYRDLVSEPFGFMLTALCHDFGKAAATEVIKGKICSYHHETIGLPLAETFLRRLTNEAKRIDFVLNLTEFHMRPNTLIALGSSEKSTNKMFDGVFSPRDLVYFAKADHFGRITSAENEFHEEALWERLRVYEELMKKPYVMGRDLMEAGLRPDPFFKELLDYAHKLRLAGIPKDSALVQTLAYARKNHRL